MIMTRTADTAVDLWSRVTVADTSGAELLVSIHNNALPDGVNPFTNNGTTVFYNQPRSLPLAAEIQRALVRRLRLPDLGIGRADLALVRPTWMPAALSEGMFVILPDQEARLRSVSGQRLYAQGVLEGIQNFLRGRPDPGLTRCGPAGPAASPKAQTNPSPAPPPAAAGRKRSSLVSAWSNEVWLMLQFSSRSKFQSHCGLLALVILALFPRSITAQAPPDRAELERFRDSLASTSDSIGLLALEKRLIDSAKVHRNDGVLHLKLGFLSLRLGDLGGHSHYDDAASEFQWAIDLQPSWPYAWYGMGLAEYGVGDSQISFVTGLKTMLGKDALTRSAVAFAKSAEVDPSFARGLVDLANTALRQRVNIKLGVALEALRRAGKTPAEAVSRGSPRPGPGGTGSWGR